MAYTVAYMTDLDVAEASEIVRITVGSQLYGTSLPGKSDNDVMTVFIEPPERVFSMGQMKTVRWRTAVGNERSQVGDTDFVGYGLRHFLALAMSGNPTILTLLFAPTSEGVWDELGLELRDLAPLLICQSAGDAFRGYMKSQRGRFLGEKKGHVPSRPELIEQYGYDTKYAMHMIRLCLQGIEIMELGEMQLPMPEGSRELCLDIRRGVYSYDAVVAILGDLEADLDDAIAESQLRPEPDRRAVAKWSETAHLRFWSRQNEVAR